MTENKADDIEYHDRGPGRSLQKVFDGDKIPPPAAFRENSAASMGTADISIERYFSKDWHEAEVDHVWRKVWQVACRVEEIPEIGDYVVYDIVDDSLIVVRTAVDEIHAYYNACLHRGNALCLGTGNVRSFRCPFHGFDFSLDGRLQYVPSRWDFKHIPKDGFCSSILTPTAPRSKTIWKSFPTISMVSTSRIDTRPYTFRWSSNATGKSLRNCSSRATTSPRRISRRTMMEESIPTALPGTWTM